MSSNSESDLGDYIEDRSPHEEGTLFLPCPDERPDRRTFFFIGILCGMFGAAIVPLSLWLSGTLIFIGYGLTAFSLRSAVTAFGRALRFGFAVTAVLGAAIVLGDAWVPISAWRIMSAPAERHLFLAAFSLMPWILGLLRYATGWVL